jgi:hypothetical protein
MLRDPYYVGDIVYKGETYEGRHPAIIDRDLFVRVQRRLEASGRAGERKRVYPHYLKGTVWCGECYAVRGLVDRRMLIQRTIGRHGGEYFYFFCRGKQLGLCESRHIPFDMVEDQVIEHYRTVQLRPEFIEWVHGQIDNALQDQAGSRRQLRDQIQGQIARLQTRVDNLIDLVADGGLAGSKAREKITEIERERAALETRLGTIEDDLSIGAEFLKGWLELLRDPYELYRTASNDMRRDLNQAIFTRIFVIDQDRAESELQEHVRLLLEAQAEWAASFGLGIEAGSNENDAEASSRGESTEGHWRKPVDLALGSSKQSLVHLVSVIACCTLHSGEELVDEEDARDRRVLGEGDEDVDERGHDHAASLGKDDEREGQSETHADAASRFGLTDRHAVDARAHRFGDERRRVEGQAHDGE